MIGSMPSDLSMKNTVSSGGFAADCFFDLTGVQTEVLREVRHGIAGPVTFVDRGNRYAGPRDHGPAKGNRRIHDDDTRVGLGRCIRFGVASERVKLDRKALRVPFNALEVHSDDFLHRLLPSAGRVDQVAVALNEQVKPIRLERLIDKRPFDMELSLYVLQRGANLRELDTVGTPNGSKDVRLDEVDEGKVLASWDHPGGPEA